VRQDALDVRGGDFRGLLTQQPEPLTALGPRILAFLALHSEGFVAEAARIGKATDESSNSFTQGRAKLSTALLPTMSSHACARRLKAAIPTPKQVAAAGVHPALAWDEARARLIDAQRYGEKAVLADCPE
jgi:hypothetical protein